MTQVPPGRPTPPSWRQGRAASVAPYRGPPRNSRGRQLFWLVAALLALVSATVGLLLYLAGTALPEFLPLAVREYTSPVLANNAWALEDSKMLAARLGDQGVAYSVQDSVRILHALDDLRKHDSKPVVVYLSALGRCKNGKVYLLGDDADPDRDDTWVPLADVVQRIAACPALANC